MLPWLQNYLWNSSTLTLLPTFLECQRLPLVTLWGRPLAGAWGDHYRENKQIESAVITSGKRRLRVDLRQRYHYSKDGKFSSLAASYSRTFIVRKSTAKFYLHVIWVSDNDVWLTCEWTKVFLFSFLFLHVIFIPFFSFQFLHVILECFTNKKICSQYTNMYTL